MNVAVIPAAGLGTRFLPTTKICPKELFPLIDKPLIQYVVEEAWAAGLRKIVIVANPDKANLASYFQHDPKLEAFLRAAGKNDTADDLARLSSLVEVVTVYQAKPSGLADAILCAKPVVEKEPFAVLLPDAVFDSTTPCIRQLLDGARTASDCMIAVQEIDPAAVDRYGIVFPYDSPAGDANIFRVGSMVEKPKVGTAPSHYGVVGRYVLQPAIFDFIDRLPPGRSGEKQITDALASYAQEYPVYAVRVEGREYDAGDKLGFIKATVNLALRNDHFGAEFRLYLEELLSRQ